MTAAESGSWRSTVPRERFVTTLLGAACLLLIASFVASLAIGPIRIPPATVIAILFDRAGNADAEAVRDTIVVLEFRLPRTVMAAIVGAGTAVAGALMQGLLRNPLGDPGVIGISSGAALTAAGWIVLGHELFTLTDLLGRYGLPVSAFVGSLCATLILQAIATRNGHTSITAMLLGGIALTGFTSAMTGLLIFASDDQQLRDLTFWMLGSLGGATWDRVLLALPFVGALLLGAPLLSRGLDALALGEANAHYIGIPVETVKRTGVFLVAIGIGGTVAVSGVIAFFGLTVPHIVRLSAGPQHRFLIPMSAVLGAALLILADLFARTIVTPAELPLGIVTSAIGAPLMLWLVTRGMRGHTD